MVSVRQNESSLRDQEGKSPVSVLYGNIIHEFESLASLNCIDQRKAVNSNMVNREIKLLCDKAKPIPPYAELDSRRMVLHEPYLQFLWGYIYSSIVIYEECIQRKLLDGTFDGSIALDSRLTQRAYKLQKHILDLSSTYCEWNTDEMPNPVKFYDAKEKSYSLKTNAIFQKSVSFLLMHEYAHLVLGHSGKEAGNQWSLDQEKDADNFALSCLFDSTSLEKDKRIIGLSIILVLTSNFLMTEKFDGTWQMRHPHLQNRIFNATSSLDFETEESKSYFYYFASMEIRRFVESYGVSVELMVADTAEDLFFHYMDQLDKYKPEYID